jgi:Tfp pilus assembly ATPase PilU
LKLSRFLLRDRRYGQRLFDQHLLELDQKQLISHEEALRIASTREQLTMAMRGTGKSAAEINRH